jgi:2-polyprenyl-3-methyl-5-hydroxy-6-metoxy-1,4-benzoquinol methylase
MPHEKAVVEPVVRSKFSQQRYAAEFGRYEGTRPAEHPAHELLVGREGQRAHFLSLLLTFGRKGAFLVTGHRGSGKTTFVRFCLAEYSENLFRRYLRSNVARALLWDRLGHLAFGVLWIVVALLATELLQELAMPAEVPLGALDWLLIILAALPCSYPLLAAKEVLDLALAVELKRVEHLHRRLSVSDLRPMVVPIFFLVAAGYGLWRWGGLGVPEIAVSRLAVLGGWIYFVSTLFSFNSWMLPGDPGSEDPSYTLASLRQMRSYLGLGLIAAATISTFWWPVTQDAGEHKALADYNLIVAILLLACGALRRGLDQYRLARELGARGTPLFGSAGANSVVSAADWHLLGAFLLLVVAGLWAGFEWQGLQAFKWLGRWSEGTVILVVVLSIGAWCWRRYDLRPRERRWHRRGRTPQFPGPNDIRAPWSLHPRPRVLFAFKALVLVALGLELAYPLALALAGASSPAAEAAQKAAAGSWSMATRFSVRAPLFTPAAEWHWILGVAILLCILVFVEYEWVVRPYAMVRDDEALHAKRPGDAVESHGLFRLHRSVRLQYHRLAELTFFWKSFRAWLPVLVIPVNLGFDTLDHRHVIEAMLAGLKDAYRRTFLHWSSPVVMARRILLAGLVVALPLYVGDRWFSLPEGCHGATMRPGPLCPDKHGQTCAQDGAALKPWEAAACRVGGEPLVKFLVWAPLAMTDGSTQKAPVAAGADQKPPVAAGAGQKPPVAAGAGQKPPVAPTRGVAQPSPAAPTKESSEAPPPKLLIHRLVDLDPLRVGSVRIYHLLLLLLALIGARVFKTWPVSPYRQTYDRISRLLDNLSSRLREESRADGSKMSQILALVIGREKVEGREFGPFDPRTVELAFLQILSDSQNIAVHLPFTARNRLSPPVPEIVFVFDELDKIGSRGPLPGERPSPFQGPDASGATAAAATAPDAAREPLDHERERSRALHRLFADLKNILSSGSGRFVFLGGQNLHDEWLADQSARTPRLTNTFDAEIHLRSLLTDDIAGPLVRNRLRLDGIRLFVREHWYRARYLHAAWRKKSAAPWLRLVVEERLPVSFVQGRQEGAVTEDGGAGAPGFSLTIRDCQDGRVWPWSQPFNDALFEFLGYRSRGNVKKLRGLLEGLLRPIGRVVDLPEVRRDRFDCEHVLFFKDADRFRIQLVADIFRQLQPVLEQRLGFRDDKLVQALLYLADFLLKFHRRAFTWSNLGRVDELAHIHRAPDLRTVMEEMVLAWSASYLHLINNGMYDYRFESQFARELEFLSNHSEQELAAFNFTLDESEALKSTYRSDLASYKDTHAIDLIIGLGELHEFDEEYERARYYFLRATRALDEEFHFQVKQGAAGPVSFEVVNQSAEGFAAARRIATWGVARVRLMLQIGMTYERARDYERAQIEYRDARTLSSAVTEAFLGWISGGNGVSGSDWKEYFESAESDAGGYLWTLKNISILFHPLFAEAWLAEKSVSGVETGPSLVEKELAQLRGRLPFVSAGFGAEQAPAGASDVQHSNFALTMAELHNRAGTLYFFKGRQLVEASGAEERAGGGEAAKAALEGTEGYLLKALAHYATSLQEIRRFNRYRRIGSELKLNDTQKPWETIAPRGWPEFVFRVGASALSNFSESLLARVSLVGLLSDLAQGDIAAGQAAGFDCDDLFAPIASWLDGEDEKATEGQQKSWQQCMASAFPGWQLSPKLALKEWLGAPRAGGEPCRLEWLYTNSDAERLAASIAFSLAGARMLALAGYHEGSEQEYLRVARTVSSYIWWLTFLGFLEEEEGKPTPGRDELRTWQRAAAVQHAATDRRKAVARTVRPLVAAALAALDRAEAQVAHQIAAAGGNWRTLRERSGMKSPHCHTLACSLALGIGAFRRRFAGAGHDGQPLDEDGKALDAAVDELRRRLARWMHAAEATWQPARAWLRERLMEILDGHSFPVHNRLCGLKALIDSALVEGWEPETKDHIKELIELDQLYDSPLHFTSLQSGLTLGLAYLAGRDAPRDPAPREVLHEALRKLRFSLRLYVMRRSYYETIAGLYYLYDDFNDRTIHYNQAIQMAGCELASFLIAALRPLQETVEPVAAAAEDEKIERPDVPDYDREMEWQQQSWSELARMDPLWSILTARGKKYGHWGVDEFFAENRILSERLVPAMSALGLPIERRTALDFGCGVGRLSLPMSRMFDRCIGADISSWMVTLARQYTDGADNLKFVHLPHGRLDELRAMQFDFICSHFVLQHQPNLDIVDGYLHGLVRRLTPGGLLVFQLPGKLGFVHHLQLRRRLYRYLRQGVRRARGGLTQETLYSWGLFPISMLAAEQDWVRAKVDDAGGQVLRIEEEQPGRASESSYLYFVTRR